MLKLTELTTLVSMEGYLDKQEDLENYIII